MEKIWHKGQGDRTPSSSCETAEKVYMYHQCKNILLYCVYLKWSNYISAIFLIFLILVTAQ